MLKFKVGLMFGFALGWAVGSGKAKQFWEDMQGKPATRPARPFGEPSSVGHVTTPRGSQGVAAGS